MSEGFEGREGKDLAPVAASPAPAALAELVLDGLPSPHSRRAYGRALEEFLAWYPSNASGEGFTRALVQRYRSHLEERSLSAASINLHLSAVRKLASEAAANYLIDPGAAAAIGSVSGARRSGTRSGNWLTLSQTQRLLAEPDPETKKACGIGSCWGFWWCAGCGGGNSPGWSLAMSPSARVAGRSWTSSASTAASAPSWVFWALDECAAAAGITSGPVLRPVSKGGLVGNGPVSSQAVFETVIRCARLAGLGKVTPHDLRRTFAKLAHQGRTPLEQIQISLGHASIQTTERYLGLRQNLHDAPCDRLGLVGWEG